MDSAIKNVIFDFGGVLVNLDKQRTVEAFSKLGFDASGYVGQYSQTGIFSRLEAGETTPDAFCTQLRSETSISATDQQIYDAWNEMLTGIPRHRLDKILELREHYMVYLLSNTNVIHWTHSCKNLFHYHGFYAEDYFEKLYLSFEMHCCKPDKGIFEKVIVDTGILPQETLFIDDSEENCNTAGALGIRTHHMLVADDWMDLF